MNVPAPAPPNSRTSHRVVVAMTDGRRERGYVYNFSPNATTFHLFPSEVSDPKFASSVELKATKAIFFVRTHQGDRARREAMRKNPEDPRTFKVRGHKLKIVFCDGEEMFASTENYSPARLGFFVYPLDPGSNNLRIFVVNENVRQVTTGNALAPSGPSSPQDRLLKQGTAAAPAPPETPPPVADTCALPLDQRAEAVLRIIAGENPADVADETGIPPGVLSHWARLFLQAGRAVLGGAPALAASPAGSDERDEVIKDLATRVCALEDELDRVKGAPPRRF